MNAPGYKKHITPYVSLLLVIVSMLWPLLVQAEPLQSGLSYLEGSQAPDGSWGNLDATYFRDTTVVVDTFSLLGIRADAYLAGAAAISTQATRNNDHLARQTFSLGEQGQDISLAIQALQDSQHNEIFDASALDFPGRGWGLASGFGVTTLDTALVLRTLRAAGVPSGLSVVGEEVPAAGQSTAHPFEVTAGSTDLILKVREISGQLRFTLTDPGGAGYFVDISPGSTPVNVGPFPMVAGTWNLSVDNFGTSPATYTAEAGFTDAEGFDVFSGATALTYLGLSQNPDGGWGIVAGGDSQLMVTAEVARTLATSASVFPNILTSARDWLQAQQNPDGGFSSVAGVSNVSETALAMLAIGLADPATSLDSAATFLETQQIANGSWADDAYQTAIAMQAFLMARSLTSLPVITSNGGAGIGADFIIDGSTVIITGSLGFGIVDIQINHPGAIVEVDLETGTFHITLDLSEGVNDLVITAIDGFDRSTGTDIVSITFDSSLLGQDIQLEQGFNMVGLGLDPANPMGAIDLLEMLGAAAQEVKRLDATTGIYEVVTRAGLGFNGSNFPLGGLDSLIIKADVQSVAHVAGSWPAANTVNLLVGVNGLTIPAPPIGLDAYDLLGLIGNETAVSAIQRYNPVTGAFETAAYSGGSLVGTNFTIEAGVSYQVHMRSDVLGFVLPVEFVASIQITSPSDGAVVTTSPLAVSGAVNGEAPYTVTVNGISASVTGNTFDVLVPLIAGANVLDAEVIDGGGRIANYTISITYDDSVDYSIPPGGSATGARVFTADTAVLDQVAFYTETQIGVPTDITYTTTGVSRISATEMQINFQIDVAPGAVSATYDFQVEYGLLDAGSNPLGPLTGNLFDFRIEVRP